MGYWARWGDDPAPRSSLESAVDRLDLLVPYWFTVRPDGSLLTRETAHAPLLAYARQHGLSVLLLVNNEGEGFLRDAALRAKAVESVAAQVLAYGADGVQVDFEGLSAASRDGLSAFMTELTGRLRPEGRLVTIAVGPKTSAASHDNDGAIAYDYEVLGRLADLVVVMTYDQHGPRTGPGPVAALAWVEEVARYAASAMPPGKVLLGIAGYGYDWSSRGVRPVAAREAAGQAVRHGAEVVWDGPSDEPWFTYKTDGGSEHTIWFESAAAASQKFSLVSRYGLRGVALWSLGQEEPGLWDLIAP